VNGELIAGAIVCFGILFYLADTCLELGILDKLSKL